MTADFTLDGYRALMAAFGKRGYRVGGFDGAEPNAARRLILRHDLDMSLDAALPIAEIEADLGLRGSYFVLLRTEMYNPFSAGAGAVLARICALGHEIGLHLDAALYDEDLDALERAAETECAVLEKIVGRAVDTISFHRPPKTLLGLPGTLAGRRHAYEPVFFRDIGYCSDSRGGWHHGHPLDHPAVADGRGLQLLTHPIWWARPTPAPVQDALETFARERYRLLRDELGRNCQPFDPNRPPPADADNS